MPANFREASKLGQLYNALQNIHSDNPETVAKAHAIIAKLSKQSVKDINGKRYPLKQFANVTWVLEKTATGGIPDGESIYAYPVSA